MKIQINYTQIRNFHNTMNLFDDVIHKNSYLLNYPRTGNQNLTVKNTNNDISIGCYEINVLKIN